MRPCAPDGRARSSTLVVPYKRHDPTMREREPDDAFSFGRSAEEEADHTRAEQHRQLGKRLSLAGLIIALLVTAGMAVYIYRPDPAVKLLEGTPLEMAPRVTRAYKWRDADGNWQLTDTPPAAGVEYQVIDVSSATNILPSPVRE